MGSVWKRWEGVRVVAVGDGDDESSEHDGKGDGTVTRERKLDLRRE